MRPRFGAWGLAAGLVVACAGQHNGNDKADRVCTPGAYVFCRCADRTEGSKLCNDDALTFQECLPCDGSGRTPPGGGGTDGIGSRRDDPPPVDLPRADSGSSVTRTDGGPVGPRDAAADGPGSRPSDGGGRDASRADAGAPVDAGDPDPDEDDAGATEDAGTTGGGGGGGGRDAGGSVDAGAPNAQHCKPLTNIASDVTLERVADTPPTARGGSAANGTYVQTWVLEFTGAGGEAGAGDAVSRETLELKDGYGRFVYRDGEGREVTGGFELIPDGTKVTVAYECPSAAPRTFQFDASEREITIYDPPFARVFVRQRGAR